MDWAKTSTRRNEKHLGFGIWCSYIRGLTVVSTVSADGTIWKAICQQSNMFKVAYRVSIWYKFTSEGLRWTIYNNRGGNRS